MQERAALAEELGENISLDALTGPDSTLWKTDATLCDDAQMPAGWLIAQRTRGHRHSIDDVLTAWYALKISPPVASHLDLGTGIGTVGLLVHWGMGPHSRLTGIEAQPVSFRLWQSNVLGNQLSDQIRCLHGDLRDLHCDERFPLITGSPPYFPVGTGVLPADSQKAHARFELRGGVEAYAQAAKRQLTRDGWFVFCFPYAQKARALAAVTDSELCVHHTIDVVPRATLPILFSLFACRHAEGLSENVTPTCDTFVVREASGRLSASMAAVRRTFGFRDSAAHGGWVEEP